MRAAARGALPAAGRNWLLVVLMTAGLALRVAAQIAYQPALLYIDSVKYLYNAYPGADPVGYKAPLKAMLAVGNLGTVTAVQHLLGLAMAVAIYVILIRRNTPRWLAAIAVAPVLLDAYQIQIEQNIMPDVWFEALIVAGIAVLLASKAGPRLGAVIAGGLLLGASATVRQVGEVLILPALLFLLAAGGGWRKVITRGIALTGAFAVPVVGYMAGSLADQRPFLAGHRDAEPVHLRPDGRRRRLRDAAHTRLRAAALPDGEAARLRHRLARPL